jgi:molybdate transport system substrate-binding protein
MRRRGAFATLIANCSLALAACGSSSSSDSGHSGGLVVSAASSLQTAFTDYANEAGFDARQSFAGSDELAAQIRQGVTPDVFAAANTALPDELHKDGLVGRPVVFAANSLVVAVPDGSAIHSLDDLTRPGTTIAIGDAAVPVGAYTHEVLGRLPTAEGRAILANVRSQEPDDASIVGKVTQGAVDAGFVYVTDITATEGELRAIELPASLQPDVAYGAAVVDGAQNKGDAKRFIDGLLHGEGAAALRRAGFKPPPG